MSTDNNIGNAIKVGKVIRDLRIRAGMSVSELSRTVGNGSFNVAKYESGVTTPAHMTILKLSKLFCVSPSVFFAGCECGLRELPAGKNQRALQSGVAPQPIVDPFISQEEIRRIICIPDSSIRKLIREKKMPQPIVLDGHYRWRDSEIQQWIENDCKMKTTPTESGQ